MELNTQKTVLITGANNPEGIGAAIAKLFYNNGFQSNITWIY